MKRRLIIFPGNFLPHIGGLETHVDEFVKYLSKNKNYDITIFSPNIVGACEQEIIHNNVNVIRYPAFEIVSNFPIPKFWKLKFWRLFLGLYKNEYEIVMTRTRFFTNSFLGAFFAKVRLSRKKLVHVEHGSDYVILESKFKTFVAKFYDYTLGKFVFVVSDKSIAISDAVYKFVHSEFIRTKEIPIIRRGVDFEKYNVKDKDILKRFKGKIRVSFIGRLYKWKGVENSILAYKKLPIEMQKKSVFIIVGPGEDFQRLQEVAGKYLDNGIYFFGKTSFEESIHIFKESDIYLHSAYPGGGLSNSLLQAMFCKCAIVASPYEGANEVLKEGNGILLENNSVKSILGGLKKMIKDKSLRKKYGNNAHNYVKKNFGWDDVIKKYEEVFDEVLK